MFAESVLWQEGGRCFAFRGPQWQPCCFPVFFPEASLRSTGTDKAQKRHTLQEHPFLFHTTDDLSAVFTHFKRLLSANECQWISGYIPKARQCVIFCHVNVQRWDQINHLLFGQRPGGQIEAYAQCPCTKKKLFIIKNMWWESVYLHTYSSSLVAGQWWHGKIQQ